MDNSDPRTQLYYITQPDSRGRFQAYPVPQMSIPRAVNPSPAFMTVDPTSHQVTRQGRRLGMDLRAAGKVKSDHWHHQPHRRHCTVNRNQLNSAASLRVDFMPDDCVGVGVALTECLYDVGMLGKDEIFIHLFPGLENAKAAPCFIRWPGYSHVQYKFSMQFKDTHGLPYDKGQVACQVAKGFKHFIETYGDQFNRNERGAVKLGPRQVTFEDLRLIQLYTVSLSPLIWTAEVSYILPE